MHLRTIAVDQSRQNRSIALALTLAVAAALVTYIASAVLFSPPVRAEGPPTPEEYAAYVGGGAKIVAPGKLLLDGRPQTCGRRPTVLDNQLDDYGAAYPGFLIMNPKLLDRVSTPVKLWIYAHECAHQFRGPDEETADCFAVQRGRRQGWLTPEGVEEVCNFIRPAKSTMMHLSGSRRCEYMRECYADPKVR